MAFSYIPKLKSGRYLLKNQPIVSATSPIEINELKRIGLTLYQAKAFSVLSKDNPLSAREISDLTGIPSSKIYEVLYALRKLQLVGIKTEIEFKKGSSRKHIKILQLISEGEKLGLQLRLQRGGMTKNLFYADDIRTLIKKRSRELKKELMFLNKMVKKL